MSYTVLDELYSRLLAHVLDLYSVGRACYIRTAVLAHIDLYE